MPLGVQRLRTCDQLAQQRLELHQREDGRLLFHDKKEDKFYGIEYHHVVQANNQVANELSMIGST